MNIAVVFAGGVGKRMKTGGLPKQFLEVNEKPILVHTLSVFQDHEYIDAIVLVMVADWIGYTQELIAEYKLDKVVTVEPGGQTGQESIYHGLMAARRYVRSKEGDGAEYRAIVLLHDGVRPMIDADLISANIMGVKKHGSAITCVPCNETVVMVDDDGDQVVRTVERRRARMAKAPQSFYLADIIHAHERALLLGERDAVDSCTMMRRFSAVSSNMALSGCKNAKVAEPEGCYSLKMFLDVREGRLGDI